MVKKFTETYMDNSTFCSDNYAQNYKLDENILIRSGNKIKNILSGDSFSKNMSGIDNLIPPQENYPPVIRSGITSTIPIGNNSNIPSGNVSPIPPSDLSKIPEDIYTATF